MSVLAFSKDFCNKHFTPGNNPPIVPLITFLCVLICYSYFIHFIGTKSWNVTSRLALTYAIADQGTFRIDDYHLNTGDKAYYNGHYYSDKAPGASFLALPFYYLLKSTGIQSEKYTRYILTLFVIALPSALSLFFFLEILKLLGISDEWHRVIITLSYYLCTPAFPFSTILYGHQLAAACSISAFYFLFKIRIRKESEITLSLLLSGLMAGWAYISDYPSGIIMVFLTVYCIISIRRKPMFFWWVTGLLIPIGILFYYNFSCFGGIFQNAYKYHEIYNHQEGFMGIKWPRTEALWGISFSSYRGIFYQSPLLLLSIPGVYYFRKQREYKNEFFLYLFIVIAFLTFNSGFTYWNGVGSVNARFMIPALPFLVLLSVRTFQKWPDQAVVLSLISFVFMLTICATEPRTDYRIQNPLFYFNFFLLSQGFASENLGVMAGLGKWPAFLFLPIVVTVCIIVIRKTTCQSVPTKIGKKETMSMIALLVLTIVWIIATGLEGRFQRTLNRAHALYHYYGTGGKINLIEAETEYLNAMSMDPFQPSPYKQLVKIAKSRRKPALALTYYDKQIQNGVQPVTAMVEKAILLNELGETKMAESLLNKASSLADKTDKDEDLIYIHRNIGNCYDNLERFEDAAYHYREALQINPNLFDMNVNIGVVLQKQGKADQALSYYEKALTLRSDKSMLHNNIGSILRLKGELEKSIFHLRTAIRLDRDNGNAKKNIALALAETENYEEAILHLSDFVRIHPDDREAHYNLGSLLLKVGDNMAAIEEYCKALKINPDWTKPKEKIKKILMLKNKMKNHNESTETGKAEDLCNDSSL